MKLVFGITLAFSVIVSAVIMWFMTDTVRTLVPSSYGTVGTLSLVIAGVFLLFFSALLSAVVTLFAYVISGFRRNEKDSDYIGLYGRKRRR